MPGDPHYFIGIPVPEDIANVLIEWQDILDPFVNYRKWIHKDDFHITLKFLGGVSKERLELVKDQLTTLNKVNLEPININGVNFFGKEEQPRVMYAEVKECDMLSQLKLAIEDRMERIQFLKDQRPYRPHITLAKKWTKGKLYTSIDILDAKLDEYSSPQFNADVFHLYRVYPEQIPKYKVVETFTI
ncbi:RNA 2',3'-cyclic phosphodiesterase [Bacillaceae bacterium W0354]